MTAPQINTPTMPVPTPTAAQSARLNDLNSAEKSARNDLAQYAGREDLWHNLYVSAGALTGILAILSFAFQRLETRNIKLERSANAAISKIEVERHSTEKQVSDLAIAQAQGVAARATEQAGRANERAGGLESEAATQRRVAADLQHQTEVLRQQNNATEENLTAANRQIEAERTKRVNLAVSLLPRTLLDQSSPIRTLRGVKPKRVLLVFADESEPKQFAEQIAFIFGQLHWRFFGRRPLTAMRPGISVGQGRKGRKGDSPVDTSTAESLEKALREAGVEFNESPMGMEDLTVPPDTLVVWVGPKPNRVLDEALKELGGVPVPPGTEMFGNRRAIPDEPVEPNPTVNK